MATYHCEHGEEHFNLPSGERHAPRERDVLQGPAQTTCRTRSAKGNAAAPIVGGTVL